MKNEKNWTELLTNEDTRKLMSRNRDILEEEIKIVNAQGYIETVKLLPKWATNKYFLYEFLRKNDRCQKCVHAEKVLKKSTAKGS
jgi:hypothetical protein